MTALLCKLLPAALKTLNTWTSFMMMAVSGKLQVRRLWRDCEGNNVSMPQPRVLLASGLVNKITIPIQKEDKLGSFKMVNKFLTHLSTSGFWRVHSTKLDISPSWEKQLWWAHSKFLNETRFLIFMRNVEQILNLPLYLWNSFEHSCIFQQLSLEIGDSGCYQDLGPDSCPDVHQPQHQPPACWCPWCRDRCSNYIALIIWTQPKRW